MENKKDIGKAFREKLDNLQKQPDISLWDAIHTNLPEKKRRFLPLFWTEASSILKIALITLSLLFAIITGYLLKDYNTNNITEPGENNTGNTQSNIHPDKNNKSVTIKDISNKANTSKHVSDNENNEPNTQIWEDKETYTTVEVTDPTKQKETNILSETNGKDDNANSTTQATNRTSGDKIIVSRDKRGNTPKKTRSNNILASYNLSETGQKESQNNNYLTKNTDISGNKKTKKRLPVKDSKYEPDDDTKERFESLNSIEDNASDNNIANNLIPEMDTEFIDTISQLKDSLSVAEAKDSIAICKDVVEENTTKSDSSTIANFKQFYVFAHVSPTQYMLNDALLPDAKLSANKTTTKVSFNYGVFIGYNFNRKWSLRTGIAMAGLQHTTKNALLKSTYSVVPGNPGTVTTDNGYVHLMPPSNYTGINYTRNGSNAAIVKHLGTQANEAMVDIIQKIEFIEIPVEMTYNVCNTKLSVGILGGISTVLTTKNIVYAQNNRGTMWLGETKNVKNVGFSGTVGFHFSYKVIPELNLNAEPVFKYYLNTFSNSTPYSFGLQAGLQYDFNLFSDKK
ncbi:hypothetical protein GR160_07250 [Flavobacterium sp. Sd200]|uniref:hypothetical protein n=1 Tax=Flavobacterium sp. Sd200 TaxID=2692211 RepID=UPI00136A1434|nr:hypothetical protein [Flavobacterium sp. Sd200]MXN91022.1 hypothetical protein [Flavobacterium sp. Sd200]